jgi:hypothetical protein
MSSSILTSTKKVLGISEEYTAFDVDVIMHINSVFTTLNELGIGPVEGFQIEDASTTWEDYLDAEMNFNSVKSYMYLRVRLLFDPPNTSYLINALKEQAKEMEWRLNVVREFRDHPTDSDESSVIDGGGVYAY